MVLCSLLHVLLCELSLVSASTLQGWDYDDTGCCASMNCALSESWDNWMHVVDFFSLANSQ